MRLAEGRVDFRFEWLARVRHRGTEESRRRQVVIVLCLKKENRCLSLLDRAQHPSLQRGRIRPTLCASGRIDSGADALPLDSQDGLDAAERVTCDANPFCIDLWLGAQPGQRGELVVQMIGFEQTHHHGGAFPDAAVLHRCVDLVANERPGTQPLATPIRPEEDPPMPHEYRTERVECFLACHASRTAVVVQERRIWARSAGLEQASFEREVTAWKLDDFRWWLGNDEH